MRVFAPLTRHTALSIFALVAACGIAVAQGQPPSARPGPPSGAPATQASPPTAPLPATAAVQTPPAQPPTAGGASLDPKTALQKAMTGSTDGEIRFGMTGPFSGPSKEFGRQLAQGVDIAFQAANDAGGIAGRRLKLVRGDDGYEPARTPELVKRMVEQDKVSGFIGSFGTPNAEAVLPWLQERKVLFFAPFTGAPVVRATPPDTHVFNYRPSYAEETEAAVRYLVSVRGIKPAEIAVFAQDDGFGQAGYDGAAKALRALSGGRLDRPPLHLKYRRNTIDVAEAVATIKRQKFAPKAYILVALYRPAAKFIENMRPFQPSAIFTNVSAVGSSSLAEELALLGPKFADGVIVTQVVPAASGYSKIVSDYKASLNRYAAGEKPDYLSLEGYVEAKLLIEALRRVGNGAVDGDKLAVAFESMGNYDSGLGSPISFSSADHQAVHTVWGTMLDGTGNYKAIDLK